MSAVISLSSGCSLSKLVVHPEPHADTVAKLLAVSGKRSVDERLNDSGMRLVPPGGNLEGKITVDTYEFVNRFNAHLRRRIDERRYADLQESKLRDFLYFSDKTQHNIFARSSGRGSTDYYAEFSEREFSIELYRECQRMTTSSVRDAIKDINLYEHVKPVFEFNLKRDKIPFTDTHLLSVVEKKDETAVTANNSIDEFDDRIRNPHKFANDEFKDGWLTKRLADVSFGVNVDFDVFNITQGVGVQPYLKWADIFRWTYNTKNNTVEHKISFPVYGFGFGMSAETPQTFEQLNKIDFGINYVINSKTSIGFGGFKKFYDSGTGDDRSDEGASFGVFMKF